MMRRLTVGFIGATILSAALLGMSHTSIDKILPVQMLTSHMSRTVTGYVTGASYQKIRDGLSPGPLWDTKLEVEWCMDYRFQVPSDRKDEWETGTIPLRQGHYDDKPTVPIGSAVTVAYDPDNPEISGLAGTNKINTWAYQDHTTINCFIAFVCAMFGISELMKRWNPVD